MDEFDKNGSANAGSPQGSGPESGQPDNSKKYEDVVPAEQYRELESKMGSMGKELGDYRNFFKEVEPLLDELQGQEELVNAILDKKVNSDLAKAVVEGRVTIADAQAVAQANEEVKKELGKEGYEKADPAKLEKMISSKIAEASEQFDKKLSDAEERRLLEKDVEDFVSHTKDFDTYAEGIANFFAENPNQYDIRIAYNSVKGAALAKEKGKADEAAAVEAAKRMAANAGGGGSQSGALHRDDNLADRLIGGHSNPNHF